MSDPNLKSHPGKITVTVDADLEDIVPNFLQNRHKDIEKIGEALTGNDFETIRVLGHSMKGAGGGYGFDRITDIGRAIEDAAKAQNPDAVRHEISHLADYLKRVEVVFEA